MRSQKDEGGDSVNTGPLSDGGVGWPAREETPQRSLPSLRQEGETCLE